MGFLMHSRSCSDGGGFWQGNPSEINPGPHEINSSSSELAKYVNEIYTGHASIIAVPDIRNPPWPWRKLFSLADLVGR
ncbi:hypothetical protein SDJN03_26279, partial [Cucurbita argyrosperma subsp. sororia]